MTRDYRQRRRGDDAHDTGACHPKKRACDRRGSHLSASAAGFSLRWTIQRSAAVVSAATDLRSLTQFRDSRVAPVPPSTHSSRHGRAPLADRCHLFLCRRGRARCGGVCPPTCSPGRRKGHGSPSSCCLAAHHRSPPRGHWRPGIRWTRDCPPGEGALRGYSNRHGGPFAGRRRSGSDLCRRRRALAD